MTPIRATYVDAFGVEHPLNSAAIVEARKNSPDWQAAQNVATALLLGEQFLNVESAERGHFRDMKVENRHRLVDLVRRFAELSSDARALVNDIDRDLQKSI